MTRWTRYSRRRVSEAKADDRFMVDRNYQLRLSPVLRTAGEIAAAEQRPGSNRLVLLQAVAS